MQWRVSKNLKSWATEGGSCGQQAQVLCLLHTLWPNERDLFSQDHLVLLQCIFQWVFSQWDLLPNKKGRKIEPWIEEMCSYKCRKRIITSTCLPFFFFLKTHKQTKKPHHKPNKTRNTFIAGGWLERTIYNLCFHLSSKYMCLCINMYFWYRPQHFSLKPVV